MKFCSHNPCILIPVNLAKIKREWVDYRVKINLLELPTSPTPSDLIFKNEILEH
nr:MAG TPA: hypothetical protein [Herelleviridae sp.]